MVKKGDPVEWPFDSGWHMESGRNTLPDVKATSVREVRVEPVGSSGAVPTPTPAATELAGTLHEVSNALTVVIGWLDEALGRDPAPRVREALEVARAHAAVGHRLARQGIGAEVPLAPERLAASIARDAVVGIQPKARCEGVEIVLDTGTANAVVGDSPAAMQILVNLLLNAIAFTPRGARVTLSLREQGRGVVFQVADEGPGVSPERAGSLLTSPSSTRRGGAGIGLTHSAALAYDHGGRLELARPGPGAVFELSWPAREVVSGAQHRSTPPPASLAGRRVLVVEDDANVLALVEIALEARGAQVLSAVCPPDMIEILANGQTFDAALIDLSPFANDGSDALSQLRHAVPGVGVVLMSGHVGDLPNALTEKVARWVRKPFEMSELVAAVEAVVGA
ncbi:MAG: response regulator [Polyangiaceae bacterium]|nr:response regulator [Polyangiaceae bacterium]